MFETAFSVLLEIILYTSMDWYRFFFFKKIPFRKWQQLDVRDLFAYWPTKFSMSEIIIYN